MQNPITARYFNVAVFYGIAPVIGCAKTALDVLKTKPLIIYQN